MGRLYQGAAGRLILSVLVVLGLVGMAAPAAGQEQVELTVWSYLDPEDPSVKAYIERFQEQNPGIVVKYTAFPEDDYQDKVRTALSANSPPDIAVMEDKQWMQAGLVVELTPTSKSGASTRPTSRRAAWPAPRSPTVASTASATTSAATSSSTTRRSSTPPGPSSQSDRVDDLAGVRSGVPAGRAARPQPDAGGLRLLGAGLGLRHLVQVGLGRGRPDGPRQPQL